MRHGIREFRARQPLDRQLSGDTLNKILRELESLRITNVVNGTFRKLPSGTEIVVAPQRGGATAAVSQPWDLIARTSESNPNQYIVTVRPGTLNGILPSNWDEEFTCANTGIYYAKAVVATDGLSVTGVTLEIDTNAPSAQDPQPFGVEASIDYLFGLFSEGQVYRVIGSGHINLVPEQWLTKDKSFPADAGELPYEIFYRLQ